MIYVQDLLNKRIFTFETETQAEEFFESYYDPSQLQVFEYSIDEDTL